MKIDIEIEDDLGNIEYDVMFTLEDLSNFFKQIRGFPTILTLGKYSGEGQSGGRWITGIAKQVEEEFIEKYGKAKYISEMDKLMER